MNDGTIKAVYIPVDGDRRTSIKNLHKDTVLEESRLLIGCSMIETYNLGACTLLLDEVGAILEDTSVNARATLLTCIAGRDRFIFGNVLVVGPLAETWSDAPEAAIAILEDLLAIEIDAEQ